MNTKTKNQLRLQSIINQRIKIQKTIYADSYGESKDDILKALDILIEQRTVELEALNEHG